MGLSKQYSNYLLENNLLKDKRLIWYKVVKIERQDQVRRNNPDVLVGLGVELSLLRSRLLLPEFNLHWWMLGHKGPKQGHYLESSFDLGERTLGLPQLYTSRKKNRCWLRNELSMCTPLHPLLVLLRLWKWEDLFVSISVQRMWPPKQQLHTVAILLAFHNIDLIVSFLFQEVS